MQTFSGMQRSFSYQNTLSRLLLIGAYTLYISLSSLYLLLPPMLALLFYAFSRTLQKHDLPGFIVVTVMLLLFEAEKGFWFGSTILFFSAFNQYILPKIEQVVQCRICMAAIYVLAAYPGYWIFMWITNQVLMITLPQMDWYMGLYVIIEFLILAVAQ